jgi:carboxyl-terminal processing protease
MRTRIELPLVDYEMLKNEGIGYIHILSFGENTFPQLADAIHEMEQEGIQNLILDLRGNPGGTIDSVLQVASIFIGDVPIMWIKDGANVEEYYSSYNNKWWDKPIVLLIDQGSASASEVLAGALKDYHLATVIGDNSYGKGVMQRLIPLPSGNSLKLTTNEFFSPNKTKIQNVGIQPDVFVEAADDPIAYALEWLKQVEALRSGKKGEITLEVDRVKDMSQWVLQKDEWYIALYRLHGIFGGELVWDSKKRATTYKINGIEQSFSVDKDRMIVKDGHIYVPIQSLKGIPNLTITKDLDGNITIKR